MIRLILPLLLSMLAGCLKPAAVTSTWMSPPSGTLLTVSGQELSDAHLTELARQANFVLIGESHTNLCDHTVQARVIEALAASGQRFVLGLEMLPVTTQPALDRFNAGAITPDNLGREADWDKLWGYPYAQYEPIFELARRHDLPVAALNTPREVLTRFREQGRDTLPPQDQALLPQRIIEVSPAQRKALSAQLDMHMTMRKAAPDANATAMPPMAAMSFYTTQALWDSMMAEQALLWHRRTELPVVILAGAGHVEHGWGIEYRLRTLAPEARCLAVVPVRDAEDWADQTDPSRRAQPGTDIFSACAAQHKSRLGMNIVFEPQAARVEAVDPDSLAAKAGLQAGDVLLEAGGKAVQEATDLHFAAMSASRTGAPLVLFVRRGNATINIVMPLR